ncbi:hypothetical protein HT031_005245 [Scenedesmus sp. PABB004]|nr:hypothetical protein HT031_005245 [Scenedesmus sp. PABB004]
MHAARAAAAAAAALLGLALAALAVEGAPLQGGPCAGGSCASAAAAPQLPAPPPGQRRLRQWGTGFAGCAGRPLVIAHGATPPTNIDDLVEDMQSPLTKVDITSNANFQMTVKPDAVELISLTDPAACIRGLTTVRGALAIYDDGSIPDLSALSRLRTVQSVAGLNIAHMRLLTSLEPLSGLTINQGDLVVLDNANITSLAGVGSPTQLYGRVWLDSNPLLRDLRGLEARRAAPRRPASSGAGPAAARPALTTVDGDVSIRNMPNLTSLAGLGGLVSTGRELALVSLPNLTSTAALTNLTSVGLSLELTELPALRDLAGLRRLRSVPGDLILYRLKTLPTLRDLAALQARARGSAAPRRAAHRRRRALAGQAAGARAPPYARSVGLNLIIGDDGQLTTLEGLENVRSVGTLLSVSFNPKLTSLKGLGGLQSIGEDLVVRGNGALITLSDLPRALRVVGALRGGDAVHGHVTVARNAPALPGGEADALRALAAPLVMTPALLRGGVAAVAGANATAPAAAANTTAPAVPAAAANATAPAVQAAAANASAPAARGVAVNTTAPAAAG